MSTDGPQTRAALAAIRALDEGDARQARALVQAGEAAAALAARAHLALVDEGDLPAFGDVAAYVDAPEDARGAAAVAASAFVRAAVLACDRRLLDDTVDVQRRLAVGTSAAASIWRAAGEGWQHVMDPRAPPPAEDLAARGKEHGLGGVIVESVAQRALVAASGGDLRAALAAARRAALMAQAERNPLAAYLAHLVLARVRRLAGRPHLAALILASLARVAPRRWRFLVGWEQAFAPALEGGAAPGGVAGLCRPALAGDREGFDAAGARLLASVAGWRALADEAAVVVAAMDPQVAPSALPEAIAGWSRGAGPWPPGAYELAGDDPSAGGEPVVVVAGPGRAPRRVLRPGQGLASDAARIEGAPEAGGHPARVYTALAVLALAGRDGIADEDFFRAVYGFAYVEHLHRSNLDELLYRARKRLGDRGEIVRTGRLVFAPSTDVSIPDPRCSPPVDNRVLAVLAQHGPASARDTAAALGMPLRTVQAALRELLGDGVITAEGNGTRRRYRLEDTTFSPPTRH